MEQALKELMNGMEKEPQLYKTVMKKRRRKKKEEESYLSFMKV